MAVSDWSTTAASNATQPGITWAEGQAPSTVNDSARQMMADIAAWYATAGAGPFAAPGANSDITSLSALSTPLSVAQGGTASTTAGAARTALGVTLANLGAAASGANSDITSLSGLSTPLSLLQGGTGTAAASAAAALAALGGAALAGLSTQTFAAADGTTGNNAVTWNQFTQSIGKPGYITFPGGLILQWGQGTASVSGDTVTFPKVFPGSAFVAFAINTNQTNPPAPEISSLGTTGFTAIVSSGSPTIYWFAIGN